MHGTHPAAARAGAGGGGRRGGGGGGAAAGGHAGAAVGPARVQPAGRGGAGGGGRRARGRAARCAPAPTGRPGARAPGARRRPARRPAVPAGTRRGRPLSCQAPQGRVPCLATKALVCAAWERVVDTPAPAAPLPTLSLPCQAGRAPAGGRRLLAGRAEHVPGQLHRRAGPAGAPGGLLPRARRAGRLPRQRAARRLPAPLEAGRLRVAALPGAAPSWLALPRPPSPAAPAGCTRLAALPGAARSISRAASSPLACRPRRCAPAGPAAGAGPPRAAAPSPPSALAPELVLQRGEGHRLGRARRRLLARWRRSWRRRGRRRPRWRPRRPTSWACSWPRPPRCTRRCSGAAPRSAGARRGMRLLHTPAVPGAPMVRGESNPLAWGSGGVCTPQKGAASELPPRACMEIGRPPGGRQRARAARSQVHRAGRLGARAGGQAAATGAAAGSAHGRLAGGRPGRARGGGWRGRRRRERARRRPGRCAAARGAAAARHGARPAARGCGLQLLRRSRLGRAAHFACAAQQLLPGWRCLRPSAHARARRRCVARTPGACWVMAWLRRCRSRRRSCTRPEAAPDCWRGTQAAGAWAVGAGADALARLLADVGALAAWLPAGYAQRLAPLLAFAPPQARAAAPARPPPPVGRGGRHARRSRWVATPRVLSGLSRVSAGAAWVQRL